MAHPGKRSPHDHPEALGPTAARLAEQSQLDFELEFFGSRAVTPMA